MLHSVCDLSGLNRMTRAFLRNGAMALAGMVLGEADLPPSDRPLVALSTLGTSETCAFDIRKLLQERGYEVVTFHTVGSGGEAMEELIRKEEVSGVVELSMHELMDHRFGGDYDAGPERGRAALEAGLPTVLVPGNIDFLVSGPEPLARKRFPDRRLHVHNAAITVVRSERHEILELARALAAMCNEAGGPLAVMVPLKGFSAFDRVEGPLHDPEAPALLAETLKESLARDVALSCLPYHINDAPFAEAVAGKLLALFAGG